MISPKESVEEKDPTTPTNAPDGLQRAACFKFPLLLPAKLKLIAVVVHALRVRLHSLWALAIKFHQQRDDTPSNVLALLQTLLGIGIVLLAIQKRSVFHGAPRCDMFRRGHQHRGSGDRRPFR